MTNVIIPDPIAAVIESAMQFKGIREKRGNRGTCPDFFNWYVIRDMHKFPTGGLGAPWCATFVITAIRLALGAGSPIPLHPAYCDVDKLVAWSRARGVFHADLPERGDLLVVRRWLDAKPDYAHTGFVLAVGIDGVVQTLEGNTNDDGSREGNGVYVRDRRPNVDLSYIRWVDAIT